MWAHCYPFVPPDRMVPDALLVQWSSPIYACRERKKAEVVDRIDKYMGGISYDVPDPDNPAKLVAIKLRRKISAMADNVTTVCSFTHLFEVTRI